MPPSLTAHAVGSTTHTLSCPTPHRHFRPLSPQLAPYCTTLTHQHLLAAAPFPSVPIYGDWSFRVKSDSDDVPVSSLRARIDEELDGTPPANRAATARNKQDAMMATGDERASSVMKTPADATSEKRKTPTPPVKRLSGKRPMTSSRESTAKSPAGAATAGSAAASSSSAAAVAAPGANTARVEMYR